MKRYLESSDVIDWKTDCVWEKAIELSEGQKKKSEIAKICFEWVRGKIRHSMDYNQGPVTVTASDVLENGTGFCYAKSHLLAAILRANDIPAGLCYQRLRIDGQNQRYCLHGLNAVYLDEFGWYRIDPRVNKGHVNGLFTPPVERLAYNIGPGNVLDIPVIYSYPIIDVIKVLKNHSSIEDMAVNLPDTEAFNLLFHDIVY